jgi:hypothetical protein
LKKKIVHHHGRHINNFSPWKKSRQSYFIFYSSKNKKNVIYDFSRHTEKNEELLSAIVSASPLFCFCVVNQNTRESDDCMEEEEEKTTQENTLAFLAMGKKKP